MRRYLYTALICFAIALIAASFIGCVEMRGVCRHDALYTASVCAEQYPARVALGKPGHGQAQCFIDGKWQWLRRDGSIVVTGRMDDFEPENYYTLDQYIEIMKASYRWK